MSKIISQMLGHDQHSLTKFITALEDKNGYPSHDVRLVAETIQKVRVKLTELGLDPDDTTAPELYHALQIKFKADSANFDAEHPTSLNSESARMALAAKLVAKNIDLPERWALKSSAAKNLLRQNPPNRIMKHLNYRSLDSMLKRENLLEIYLVAAYFESQAWQKTQTKLISQLDSTAFEMRALQLAAVSPTKWGYFETDSFFAYNAEAGCLAIIPSIQLHSAPLLSMAVLVLDGLSNFKDINVSNQAAKLSPALAWWQDMDSLIAHLDGEPVSLNIKDCALSHLQARSFETRILEASRHSFWQELISRYESQLPTDEDLKTAFDRIKGLGHPINQPAFEYVEDI
jgi:hypothetical protein